VLDPSRDSAVVFMMYFFQNGEISIKTTQKVDVGIRVLNDHTLEVTLKNLTL